MIGRFHPKILAFYGITIGFVVLLFQLATSYGESQLRAPANINGRYLSSTLVAGCPEATRLVLVIHQSGIYVNGSLQLVDQQQEATLEAAATSETSNNSIEAALSLTGLWKFQQLILSGQTPAFAQCDPASPTTVVTVQGQITGEPSRFTGQIQFDTGLPPLAITAQREQLRSPTVTH